MHPILARAAASRSTWRSGCSSAALLALLLAGRMGLSWLQALGAVALPLASAYAFVCLSAWYVARSMPISTTGAPRICSTGARRVGAVERGAGW